MSDTKYVLTEELRDRLIGNLEAMALADFYAHSNKEQAELLRSLPAVQEPVVSSVGELNSWSLAEWAVEQGFQQWLTDHLSVMTNLARWIEKRTVQSPVVPSRQELINEIDERLGVDQMGRVVAVPGDIADFILTHGYREQSELLDLAHKVVETQASNTMTHEQAADLVAKSEANIVQGYREQSEVLCPSCSSNDNLEGFPATDCSECNGTGKATPPPSNIEKVLEAVEASKELYSDISQRLDVGARFNAGTIHALNRLGKALTALGEVKP